MKQTDWKIIYSDYDGVSGAAIRLLSKEAGALLIREPSVYRIYVLPCEVEGCEISKNAFIVGLYNESETVRSLVSPEEIPEDGFLVKVIKNPADKAIIPVISPAAIPVITGTAPVFFIFFTP